jgi:hypothetical protein
MSDGAHISTGSPRGATIYTSYATRQVKAYPVFETEIESFNLFNALTLAGFSIGSACIAFAVGIWTNAAFTDKLTPEATIASKIVGPALLVFAALAFVFGFWAKRQRTTTWEQIKRESSSELRPGPVA